MRTHENNKLYVCILIVTLPIVMSGCNYHQSSTEPRGLTAPAAHDTTSLQHFRDGPGAELFDSLSELRMKRDNIAASIGRTQRAVGESPYISQARSDYAQLNRVFNEILVAEGKAHKLWVQSEHLPSRKLVARTVAEADESLLQVKSNQLEYKQRLGEKGYTPPPKLVYRERSSSKGMTGGVRRPSFNRNLR